MRYFYCNGRKYRYPKKKRSLWINGVDGAIIAVSMATMAFAIPYLLLTIH